MLVIVESIEIAGGPNWADSDRFDVEAKASGPASPEDTLMMWRTLLDDRFRLQFHREMKERPIYVLTVSKGGLKLESAAEDGTNENAKLPTTAQGTQQFISTKTSVTSLAKVLSNLLVRPVVDTTDIKAYFKMKLEWIPDRSMAQADSKSDSDGTRASLFTAIYEQAGLRLEFKKVVGEIIAIDNVQQPSEN